jgi:hypothetical protein
MPGWAAGIVGIAELHRVLQPGCDVCLQLGPPASSTGADAGPADEREPHCPRTLSHGGRPG